MLVMTALMLAIRHINNRMAIASVISALALIFAVLWQIDSVENRVRATIEDIEKQQNGDMYTSIGIRFMLWDNAWQTFESSPLFGAGFSGHGERLKESIEEGELKPSMHRFTTEPHNQYLFELAAKGVFGLGSFLLLLAFPLAINFRQLTRGDHRALAIGMVGLTVFIVYAVAGMTITLFDQRRMIHLFGFMYAIILYLHLSNDPKWAP